MWCRRRRWGACTLPSTAQTDGRQNHPPGCRLVPPTPKFSDIHTPPRCALLTHVSLASKAMERTEPVWGSRLCSRSCLCREYTCCRCRYRCGVLIDFWGEGICVVGRVLVHGWVGRTHMQAAYKPQMWRDPVLDLIMYMYGRTHAHSPRRRRAWWCTGT